jgi:hypothetical protein
VDRAGIIGPGNINGSSSRTGNHVERMIPRCSQLQSCLPAATIGLGPDGYGRGAGALEHEAAQMDDIESLFPIITGRIAS